MALPPGAMTLLLASSVALTSFSIARKPSFHSSAMISRRRRFSRCWITRSVSINSYPNTFARITPTLLLPAPGIPIKIIFRLFKIYSSCCLVNFSLSYLCRFVPPCFMICSISVSLATLASCWIISFKTLAEIAKSMAFCGSKS